VHLEHLAPPQSGRESVRHATARWALRKRPNWGPAASGGFSRSHLTPRAVADVHQLAVNGALTPV
jgi:hypothetical protein